jgi:hypothetical protein
MLLPSNVHDYLISLDLRHWKMDQFQVRYFNTMFDVYITDDRVIVKKWDDKKEWTPALSVSTKTKTLDIDRWKMIMSIAGISAPRLHPVFENILSSFNKAI